MVAITTKILVMSIVVAVTVHFYTYPSYNTGNSWFTNNHQTSSHNHDLWQALRSNNHSGIITALEHGAQLTAPNNNGITPLHWAVSVLKSSSLTKLLLEQNAPVNSRDHLEQTPLDKAVHQENSELVKLLLLYGAQPSNPEATHKLLINPLDRALFDDDTHYAQLALIHQKEQTLPDALIFAVSQYAHNSIPLLVQHLKQKAPLDQTVLSELRTMAQFFKEHRDNDLLLLILIRYLHDTVFNTVKTGDLITTRTYFDHLITLIPQTSIRDENQATLLHWACLNPSTSPDTVTYLLNKQLNPNAQDKQGQTPLHWAALSGNIPAAHELIHHGALLTIQDNQNDTPFTLSITHKQPAFARFLLEQGYIPSPQQTKTLISLLAQDPLERAYLSNDKTALERLIESQPTLLDTSNVLSLIVCQGDSTYLDHLLALATQHSLFPARAIRNALEHSEKLPHNLSCPTGQLYDTSLLTNLYNQFTRSLDFVLPTVFRKRLTEAHSCVTTAQYQNIYTKLNTYRANYLYKALTQGPDREKQTAIQQAIQAGISLNKPLSFLQEQTILQWAISQQRPELVSWLLEQGADYTAQDKQGNNAVHTAAQQHSSAIMNLILQRVTFNRSSLTSVNQYHETPLHIAIRQGHESIAKLLLNYGSPINQVTPDGQTLVDYAITYNQPSLALLLLSYGATTTNQEQLVQLMKTSQLDDYQLLVSIITKEYDTLAHYSSEQPTLISSNRAISLAAGQGDLTAVQILATCPTPLLPEPEQLKTIYTIISQQAKNPEYPQKQQSTLSLIEEQLLQLLAYKSAQRGQYTQLTYALDHGAMLTVPDTHNNTVLDYAAAQAPLALLTRLSTATNSSVFYNAILYNNYSVTKQLLSDKISWPLITTTPLHVAVQAGHELITNLLLEHEYTPHITDQKGNTPLITLLLTDTFSSSYKNCVRVLLQYGATYPETQKAAVLTYITSPLERAVLTHDRAQLINLCKQYNKPDDLHAALILAVGQGHFEELAAMYDIENRIISNELPTTERLSTLIEQAHKLAQQVPVTHKDKYYKTIHTLAQLLFYKAVYENNKEMAQYALEQGASLFPESSNGYTPVHYAAHAGHTSMLTWLHEQGGLLDTPASSLQHTPLHCATSKNRPAIVSYLLTQNVDKNRTTKEGYTPVHLAALYDTPAVLSLLIEAGASLNQVTKQEGDTPLHSAALYNSPDIVRLLLNQQVNTTRYNTIGQQPIHTAATYGRSAIVALLQEAGVPLDTREYGTHKTALHNAAEAGEVSTVRFLLEQGLSPYARDSDHILPIDYAIAQKHISTIKVLLKHGSPFTWDSTFEALIPNRLEQAVLTNNRATINNILNEKPELLFTTQALPFAIGQNKPDLVTHLLEHLDKITTLPVKLLREARNLARTNKLPDLEQQLEQYCTKHLWHALLHNPLDKDPSARALIYSKVHDLLQAGAQVNQEDSWGQTPLDRALEHDNYEIIELLLQAGAQQDHHDSTGQTPYIKALQSNNQKLITLFETYRHKRHKNL